MLKSTTKITESNTSRYILIPHEVAIDSTFPFKTEDELDIEIKGKEIIITKKK